MAITAVTNTGKGGFVINAASGDLSGCEILMAAVTGEKIIVDKIVINTGSAITVTVGEGETAGAVTTTRLGPISMAANSSVSFEFPSGLYLTAGEDLTADASGAGNVCIVVCGRTE